MIQCPCYTAVRSVDTSIDYSCLHVIGISIVGLVLQLSTALTILRDEASYSILPFQIKFDSQYTYLSLIHI